MKQLFNYIPCTTDLAVPVEKSIQACNTFDQAMILGYIALKAIL
jgi:hypothetical protein